MEGNFIRKELSSNIACTDIFPQLNNNLISLGQSCDDDYTVTLTKNDLIITKDNITIQKGHRRHSVDKLRDIPIPQHKSKTFYIDHHL